MEVMLTSVHILWYRCVTGSFGVEITSVQLHVIGNFVIVVLFNVWIRGSLVDPYKL